MMLDRQRCSTYWHRKQQEKHERERPNWGARLLFLILIIWSIVTLVALMGCTSQRIERPGGGIALRSYAYSCELSTPTTTYALWR